MESSWETPDDPGRRTDIFSLMAFPSLSNPSTLRQDTTLRTPGVRGKVGLHDSAYVIYCKLKEMHMRRPCKTCTNYVSWSDQKSSFGHIMGHFQDINIARQYSPLCNRCRRKLISGVLPIVEVERTISIDGRAIGGEALDRIRTADPILYNAIQDDEATTSTGKIKKSALGSLLNVTSNNATSRLKRYLEP
ncbi:MAG: hypothetical protein JWN86_1759 [Planctomycetota bacterium]|nr:hypothetical protein [Planctomycetota bacterium]